MSIRNAKFKSSKRHKESQMKKRRMKNGRKRRPTVNVNITDDMGESSSDLSDEDKIVLKKTGSASIKRVYIREYRGSPLAFRISLIK